MPLPNFFVIGAPKCGTTALYRALRGHPDIYMPRKEPHYFSAHSASPPWRGPRRARPPRPPITEPLEYFALFSGASGQRAIGEASTSYLGNPLAARRIRDHLPAAKLIAVLRHPVERAHSSYWFYVALGDERAPTFEEALAPERPTSDVRRETRHFALGLYHAQLSAYYALFPPEQIRVYLYEDWRERPREMLRDLFDFLGVDPDLTPAPLTRNVTFAPRSRRLHRLATATALPTLDRLNRRYNLVVPPPPVREETRRRLLALYREDIEQLQALIGRDLSHWLTPPTVAASSHTAGASRAIA